MTYKWNFGDGTPIVETTEAGLGHGYSSPGTYVATLVVNDGELDSEPAVTTVEVLPPLHARSITVTPEYADPGSNFTISGFDGGWYCYDFVAYGMDLGSYTPEAYFLYHPVRLWVWDGTFERISMAVTPSLQDLSFETTVTVPTDSDFQDLLPGTFKMTIVEGPSATITIPAPLETPHLPQAHVGGLYEGTAGQPVAFDGSGSSDPAGLPLSYWWDFGDNTAGQGPNPTHTYTSPGTYFVTLVVNNTHKCSDPTVATNSITIATIRAGVAPASHVLQVGTSGSGTTNVTGSNLYDAGTVVSVHASPDLGWAFSGWLLNGSDAGSANPYTLTMISNHDLTALFTKIPPSQHGLLVQIQGLGTTNATGIHTYDATSTIAVEADAGPGWVFAYWLRNDTNIGSANPYEVAMSENINLTAVFVPESVIPQVPLGTIGAAATMMIAVAAYLIAPRLRRKDQNINP